MPRVVRRLWRPVHSDDVQGSRRDEIIREHLRWLETRHLEQRPKDLSDYPLAQWLAQRRQSLALKRSETLASNYRNTKGKSPRRRSTKC